MITPDQIGAARKLLGWHPSVLAVKARVTTGAARRAEGLDIGSPATSETLTAIQRAFEAAGVEFLDNRQAGVRLRRASS